MENPQINTNNGKTLAIIVLIVSILLHIVIIGWAFLYIARLSLWGSIGVLWQIIPAVLVLTTLVLSITALVKRRRAKGSLVAAITGLAFSFITTLILGIVLIAGIPIAAEGKVKKENWDSAFKEFEKRQAEQDSILNAYKSEMEKE